MIIIFPQWFIISFCIFLFIKIVMNIIEIFLCYKVKKMQREVDEMKLKGFKGVL